MGRMENLRPPWKPGESGNPKGRPPSRVRGNIAAIFGSKKRAAGFYDLTLGEVDEWERAVLALSIDALKTLAQWGDAPAYPKGLAIAILTDMKNGKTTTIDKLRERQYGKPTQRVEVSGNGVFGGALMVEVIDSREQVDKETEDEEQDTNNAGILGD